MRQAGLTARENEVLETALSILRAQVDPQRIILFGSRAEGRHHPASDLPTEPVRSFSLSQMQWDFVQDECEE